jgi:hypothetical protein
MVHVPNKEYAQKVFIKEDHLAHHAQLIVQIVNHKTTVSPVLMVSKCNLFYMAELVLAIVFRNVAMEEDLNLTVMMEITKMVMVVVQIVKFKVVGLVLVDQAQELAHVFKENPKELIYN